MNSPTRSSSAAARRRGRRAGRPAHPGAARERLGAHALGPLVLPARPRVPEEGEVRARSSSGAHWSTAVGGKVVRARAAAGMSEEGGTGMVVLATVGVRGRTALHRVAVSRPVLFAIPVSPCLARARARARPSVVVSERAAESPGHDGGCSATRSDAACIIFLVQYRRVGGVVPAATASLCRRRAARPMAATPRRRSPTIYGDCGAPATASTCARTARAARMGAEWHSQPIGHQLPPARRCAELPGQSAR